MVRRDAADADRDDHADRRDAGPGNLPRGNGGGVVSECSICGRDLASSPLAGPAHARTHKNRFEELVGRQPYDYDEVRALLNRGEWPDDVDRDGQAVKQITLQEADFS